MARFTKNEQKQKRAYAKSLFIKGFDYETIAEMLGVAVSTVKNWGREDDFENARKASFIALSEMRNTVLQSWADLKEGRTPVITADVAAKYASAFEKLSSKKKTLTYIFEAFELLTEEFLNDVQKAIKKDEKEYALKVLQAVRAKTDIVITKLANEASDE